MLPSLKDSEDIYLEANVWISNMHIYHLQFCLII